MANQRQVINDFLPSEIMFKILTKLPVKSVYRFKAVNREWLAMITSDKFVKDHLCNAKDVKSLCLHKLMYLGISFSTQQVYSKYLDFSTFRKKSLTLPFGNEYVNAEVLASCNGLLLLHKGLGTYVLWNPSTRASREFSGLHMNLSVAYCCRLYGIAYDPFVDGYKVISAVRVNDSLEDTIITVYNCKTWTFSYSKGLSYWIVRNQQGVNVNETPHWLVSNQQGVGCAIIYYDLAEEAFKEVPKPDWAEDVSLLELKAHKGLLCLIHYRRGYADVWLMEHYGQQDSWTNVYPYVRCSGLFDMRPLGLTHNDHVVMEIEQHKVEIYDPRGRTFSSTNISMHRNDGLRSITYVESLVSPFE